MEIWKDIPDYEGYYQASTEGRIRSVDRVIEYERYDGRLIKKRLTGKIKNSSMYKSMNKRKYNFGYMVVLSKEGKNEMHMVPRVILKTFIGDPSKEAMVAHHKNLNNSDNKLSNLEWITQTESKKYVICRGSYKYNIKDIIYIKRNPKNLTRKEFADMFNTSNAFIEHVQKGRIYDYIK